MSFFPKSVARLRQEAKALGKQKGIPHTAALELIARSYGFPNWKAVLNVSNESRVVSQPKPNTHNDFVGGEDVSLDEGD